jgi:hypothetical protein
VESDGPWDAHSSKNRACKEGDVLADLKYGLRQFRKSPGFAITALLTLALGIGANTAIYSIMESAIKSGVV